MKISKILILLVLLSLIILLFILRSPEDSWIKDSRGVYIKHGSPSQTPSYVLLQKEIIQKSEELYIQKNSENTVFSSQCLGIIEDYAVDIVHVPRTSEDNLPENQCEDYLKGKVSHFVELNSNGEIIRIE